MAAGKQQFLPRFRLCGSLIRKLCWTETVTLNHSEAARAQLRHNDKNVNKHYGDMRGGHRKVNIIVDTNVENIPTEFRKDLNIP